MRCKDAILPPVNLAGMFSSAGKPFRYASLKETAWTALALAALLAIAFAPFLFGPYTLLNSSRDTPSLYAVGASESPDYTIFSEKTLDPSSGQQNEPWYELEHNELFGFHEAPFWNPYQAYGTPLAAAMQPQPFHPLSWIVEAKPTPRTYDVFLVIRLFIAGLFAALYIRLFCGAAAALMAGIAASFGGYFLLFYSMPHLSVETLLPALLWALELLLRAPSMRRAAYLAIVIDLMILGGMPESAALALTCGGAYFLVRLVAMQEMRKGFALALAGTALGIAAGGVVLLPFGEYIANSYNTHQPQFLGGSFVGLQGEAIADFPRLMITQLAPLAFGPPWNNITTGSGFSGVRGFSGMVVFFGAILAVFAVLRQSGKQFAQPTWFFTMVVVILELKRFASPLVNWIGALPIYRLIAFTKYEEATVTTCMALLCGFGFAALFERRIGRPVIMSAAITAVASLSLLYYNSVKLVSFDLPGARIYYGAVALAVTFIVVAAAGSLMWFSNRLWHRTAALVIIVFVLFVESTTNYYVPLFIVLNHPTPARLNAYAGAPYINFLQKEIGTSATRVLGHPVDLFPNWASAYGLDDTRTIDAIFTRNYATWMAAFNPGNAANPSDHNSSINVSDFNDPAFVRWMTLSSIGYVLVPNYAAVASHASPFLARFWSVNQSKLPKQAVGHVSIGPYVVDQRTENALYEESQITIDAPTTINRLAPFFAVDLALDPRAYSGPVCGGPLDYRLSVLDAARRRPLITARYTIDPLRHPSERIWETRTLDLRRLAGQSVIMRFETVVLGKNDCKAWPLWGEPRFVAHPNERYQPVGEQYHLVYSADANIYQFDGALRRLSIFHDVKPVTDEDAALTMLHDGTIDVRRTALAEGSVSVAPATGHESTQIDRRTSSRLEAHVTLTSSGLVMLNDTFFPGWTATVDGAPAPIVRTDYLFRGVAVSAGTHEVIFAYRSIAVTAGTVLTVFGLLGILMALLFRPRRKPTRDVFLDANRQSVPETTLA